jgi:adsorption protein B
MVGCLVPLALWIFISALDDLFVAAVWLIPRRRPFPWPSDSDLDQASERPIAILVPLWNEHRVVGQMLERNLATIHYGRYEIFAGVYPNDEATERQVAEISRRHSRVHVAMLPHNGPTSKGDCLNWIWWRMREYEARNDLHFDIVMVHDAEDLVDAESLRLINWFSRDYEMVQIPVLALPTPWHQFTHGIYCDEFAEYQQKDIPVRRRLGGFLPSNGVGTGFARAALERLAAARQGRVFDPDCLTEDYENGFRLFELGCHQLFIPLRIGRPGGRAPVATREYFPRRPRSAVRQRSRWVAGITLQGWERHGWRTSWRQRYWLWRDRKGLVGNLLSLISNLLFCSWVADRRVFAGLPVWLVWLCAAGFAMSLVQLTMRMICSARIYGWKFAAATPLRAWWGNALNAIATMDAIRQFVAARRRHTALEWRKTEHHYPTYASAATGDRRLGQLLIRMRLISELDLRYALSTQPAGVPLGEYLVHLQKVSEEHLYQALSLQAGVEFGAPGTAEWGHRALQSLPLAAIRRWCVLPYRIDTGQLHVLSPYVPTDAMVQDLAKYCSLVLRFRLVRPSEFQHLVDRFYGDAATVGSRQA